MRFHESACLWYTQPKCRIISNDLLRMSLVYQVQPFEIFPSDLFDADMPSNTFTANLEYFLKSSKILGWGKMKYSLFEKNVLRKGGTPSCVQHGWKS